MISTELNKYSVKALRQVNQKLPTVQVPHHPKTSETGYKSKF